MHTEHDNEWRRGVSEVHNTAKRESTEVDETDVTYDWLTDIFAPDQEKSPKAHARLKNSLRSPSPMNGDSEKDRGLPFLPNAAIPQESSSGHDANATFNLHEDMPLDRTMDAE